ncbi:MAG: toxin-antitoxin system HicB family antitoxin [Chloroflexi bacterium]|nr:toxin-antitoxin system HicB family antitoxin [Chloroflexota bacterium]
MTEFTTESIYEALRSLLGIVDSPERRKQVEDYIEAARLPLDSSVSELLSRFVEAVNEDVSEHYEVTLAHRPGVLNLEVRKQQASEPHEETWSLAEGEVEKITLRIPAELKELATEAAAKAGLSVNSWFVRVLARALRGADEPPPAGPRDDERGRRRGRRGGGGQRLSGWVGPEA